MDKINNMGKVIIAAVVVVIVIVLIFIYGGNGQPSIQNPGSPSSTTAITSTAGGGQPQNVATTTGGTGSNPPPATHTKPPSITISLITPVVNDQWKIGAANPITWNPAGNFSGEIDLLDGKTHSFIGVILSETGPQQTSYDWNTREYSLARYNPLKRKLPGNVCYPIEV